MQVKMSNYLVFPVLLYLPPLLLYPAPLLLLPELVHHVEEVGLVVVDARDLGCNSIDLTIIGGKYTQFPLYGHLIYGYFCYLGKILLPEIACYVLKYF